MANDIESAEAFIDRHAWTDEAVAVAALEARDAAIRAQAFREAAEMADERAADSEIPYEFENLAHVLRAKAGEP